MAHALYISDGTTTVWLTAGGNILEEYVPSTPASIESTEPLAETARVAMGGDFAATLRSLDRLFARAKARQREKAGPRVYVYFQPGGTGDTYRSELLDGRLLYDKEVLGKGWAGGIIEAGVSWLRRHYWEGPETTLVAGTQIYNHCDAGHVNYVEISSASIQGDLPAPPILRLQNTYNDSRRSWVWWVGGNTFSSPSTAKLVYEGEEAVGATAVADTDSSNGYYGQMSVGTTEARIGYWQISSTQAGYLAGRFYTVVGRFAADLPSGTQVRLTAEYPGDTPITILEESPLIALSSFLRMQVLGHLHLPPWLPGEGNLGAFALAIRAKANAAGNVALDFIHLFPSADGLREYTPRGYGVPYGWRLVDDGVLELEYTDYGGTGKAAYYVVAGERVRLWPGRDTRIYLLVRNDIGGSEILRTTQVSVAYRPRRVAL